MCLALYIGSERELPLIACPKYPESLLASADWPRVAQRFHVSPLSEQQEIVRKHFSVPNVLFAGSYEGCSCGFNYGRELSEYDGDPAHLCAAAESVVALVAYIRSNKVIELYTCWFDDESLACETERAVMIDDLSSSTFVFKQKELLRFVM